MYNWLVPRVVFPLHERLTGHDFWSGFQELKTVQWYPQEELLARSFRKAKRLLAHAYEYVPHYHELFQKAGITPADIRELSDFSQIPVTTKSAIRRGFPEKVTAANLPESRKRKGLTSGSTGMPLEFFTDVGCLDMVRSSHLLFLSWTGIGPWVPRLVIANAAHFYAHWPTGSALQRYLRKYLLGEKFARVQGWDLTVDEFVEHVGNVQRFGTYYVLSFPSYANRLAIELIERELKLPAYPKAFVSTGETITKPDEILLGKAFRCKVHNHYGLLEVPSLAQACPDHPELLHVNTERAIVRVVRSDGTDASVGEEGHILVTDLANHVMPLINYDSGDFGALGPQCPCGRGFPTIARLEGRASEVIRTPSRTILSSLTLGPLLFDVAQAFPYVWEYQAVQLAPDRVLLRVVPTTSFTVEVGEKLKKDLEEVLGPGMTVTVEAVERIELERSGKRLIIKSALS